MKKTNIINIDEVIKKNNSKISSNEFEANWNKILSILLFAPSLIASIINLPIKLLIKVFFGIKNLAVSIGALTSIVLTIINLKRWHTLKGNILLYEGLAILAGFLAIVILNLLCNAFVPLLGVFSEFFSTPTELYDSKRMLSVYYEININDLLKENTHLENIKNRYGSNIPATRSLYELILEDKAINEKANIIVQKEIDSGAHE